MGIWFFWRMAVHKKLFSALYVINIVAEALFTLILPGAIFAGIGWLSVTYLSAPEWIYAPAIVIGLLLGFYMMIKFVLTAMAGLERLEAEQRSKRKEEKDRAIKKDENG